MLGFPGAFEVDPQRELSDGVILAIHPAEGEPWIGVFELGDERPQLVAPRQVIGWPDERSLCVIHRGVGCLVRTDDPVVNEEIECGPICDLLVIPDRRLVVFADFTSLIAYGPTGVVWRSGQVAWDDVKIVRAERDVLRVTGYDPTAKASQPVFSVDLETGNSPDKPYWEGLYRPG